jgi:uncharacterized protein YdeI (YjbR/CyaY-like superfamily)
MGKKDPRVDDYIAKSADFAKPILRHVREVVHKACPDVVETMKWRTPTFDYKGIMCGMAAFKEHCVVGFWKSTLVIEGERPEGAAGSLGRLTSLKDLPSDRTLLAYIKKAAALNEQGVATPKRRVGPPKPPLKVPPYLAAALKKNAGARKTFDNFSPSQQREYVEWVTDAKTDATRDKRLATAVEWMSEGKVRHWKYQPK